MMEAVRRGAAILRQGGSALDAVVAAVIVLENDPLFNAGYGSLLNSEGAVEMDACVMVAEPARARRVTRIVRAGGVAAITRVRNPVLLARAVMEHSGHVLMAGAGAERFARECGIPICLPDELVTERARERWRSRIERDREEKLGDAHGTVGAAALDRNGRLAAATSTGGVPGKLAGRVGDSAIVGAGVFASASGAASATGHGEAIIMAQLCREAVATMGRSTPQRAARRSVLELIATQNSEAGVILVDGRGRYGYAHNAGVMEVASFHSRDGFKHAWAAPVAGRK